MDLHDLNVFATAARLGSVTKAAKSLSTVQSNVTARIRLLERELDVQLFDRTHRGITLTPKGQQLLPYAQEMLTLASGFDAIAAEWLVSHQSKKATKRPRASWCDAFTMALTSQSPVSSL